MLLRASLDRMSPKAIAARRSVSLPHNLAVSKSKKVVGDRRGFGSGMVHIRRPLPMCTDLGILMHSRCGVFLEYMSLVRVGGHGGDGRC